MSFRRFSLEVICAIVVALLLVGATILIAFVVGTRAEAIVVAELLGKVAFVVVLLIPAWQLLRWAYAKRGNWSGNISLQFNLLSLFVMTTIVAVVLGMTRGNDLHPFLIVSAFLYVTGPWTALLVSTSVRFFQPEWEQRWFWRTLLIVIFVAVTFSIISRVANRPYSLSLPVIGLGICFFWPPLISLYYLMRPLLSPNIDCDNLNDENYWKPVLCSALLWLIPIAIATKVNPIKIAEKEIVGRSNPYAWSQRRQLSKDLFGYASANFGLGSVRFSGPTLVEIELIGIQVDDQQIGALRRYNGIQSITLRSTVVSDGGLHCMSRMPSLRRIEIANAYITEAGVDALRECPRLAHVKIHSPGVDPAAVNRLQTFLSNRQSGRLAAQYPRVRR